MSIIQIILAVSCAASLNAAERVKNIFVPPRLGDVRLYHGNGKFFVCRNGELSPVNSRDVTPTLRAIMQSKGLPEGGCLLLDVGYEGGKPFYAVHYVNMDTLTI